MEIEEILSAVIKIIQRLDKESRVIAPEMPVFTDLNFDSLQMMDLLESIKGHFGVDLLATDDLLRDCRTPQAMAAAIARDYQPAK